MHTINKETILVHHLVSGKTTFPIGQPRSNLYLPVMIFTLSSMLHHWHYMANTVPSLYLQSHRLLDLQLSTQSALNFNIWDTGIKSGKRLIIFSDYI